LQWSTNGKLALEIGISIAERCIFSQPHLKISDKFEAFLF